MRRLVVVRVSLFDPSVKIGLEDGSVVTFGVLQNSTLR